MWPLLVFAIVSFVALMAAVVVGRLPAQTRGTTLRAVFRFIVVLSRPEL